MTTEEFIDRELRHHCWDPVEIDLGFSGKSNLIDPFAVDARGSQFEVATDGHHLIAIRRSRPRDHAERPDASMIADWLEHTAPVRQMAIDALRLWCLEVPWSSSCRPGNIGGRAFDRRLVARSIEPGCGWSGDVGLALIKKPKADEYLLRVNAPDWSWAGAVMQMQNHVKTHGNALEVSR